MSDAFLSHEFKVVCYLLVFICLFVTSFSHYKLRYTFTFYGLLLLSAFLTWIMGGIISMIHLPEKDLSIFLGIVTGGTLAIFIGVYACENFVYNKDLFKTTGILANLYTCIYVGAITSGSGWENTDAYTYMTFVTLACVVSYTLAQGSIYMSDIYGKLKKAS